MSDAILEVRDVCASYDRSQVLFGVGLKAPRRGAVAVLGRNGAGKTTLMKTIIGEMTAHAGEVRFDGRDATHLPTDQRVRLGLGYVPQEHGVFGRLSVRENLQVGAAAAGDRRAIDTVLSVFPKLGQRLGQPAATLSGGERKMLAIGRALLSRPKLLLLDEPTEGVWIGELALGVADYAYVIDRGRVALEGPSASVRGDARLLQYLAP